MISTGIITLAYGRQTYIDLGIALGRSLERFSPEIPRVLVTDSEDLELRRLYSTAIPLRPEWGTDVSQKLHIDQYTPFDRTLFIDCDSLVVADISFAFGLFENTSACTIGTEFMRPGDNVREADLHKVTKNLNISEIPRFNGGIYYIDKSGPQATVIQTARSYLDDYQELGFRDFRSDGPADELLMGAAMAALGCLPITDRGLLMRTPTGLIGRLHVDVVSGTTHFNKKGTVFQPAIVHFAGAWREHPVCRREMKKLGILAAGGKAAERRARIFSIGFDLGIAWQSFLDRIWRVTPRPIRLVSHGLRTRIKRWRSQKTRA